MRTPPSRKLESSKIQTHDVSQHVSTRACSHARAHTDALLSPSPTYMLKISTEGGAALLLPHREAHTSAWVAPLSPVPTCSCAETTDVTKPVLDVTLSLLTGNVLFRTGRAPASTLGFPGCVLVWLHSCSCVESRIRTLRVSRESF